MIPDGLLLGFEDLAGLGLVVVVFAGLLRTRTPAVFLGD